MTKLDIVMLINIQIQISQNRLNYEMYQSIASRRDSEA